MYRWICVAVAAVVLVAGCGEPVSEEDVREAVMVSYSAIMLATISASFGETDPGVTVDLPARSIEFVEYSLSAIDSQYASLSGQVGPADAAAEVQTDDELARLTLTGGPINTLQFALDLNVVETAHTLLTEVIADGSRFELEIGPGITGE